MTSSGRQDRKTGKRINKRGAAPAAPHVLHINAAIGSSALPLFSEVRESEACRWLILLFVPHTCDHEYDDSYYVWEHLVKLLHSQIGSRWYEQVQNIKTTEQHRCEYS